MWISRREPQASGQPPKLLVTYSVTNTPFVLCFSRIEWDPFRFVQIRYSFRRIPDFPGSDQRWLVG